MRCGILIIGSLLWDSETKGRADWRSARLDVGSRVPVCVPIYYGRKSCSRDDTFTMAFKPGDPSGQGVLVACTAKLKSIENLIAEANTLWRAEAPKAKPDTLHTSWGCVGALFGTDQSKETLATAWTNHFRKVKAECVSVINPDGLLDIDLPKGMDCQSPDFDVILATATLPEAEPPTAHAVANAWLAQRNGKENYFFNNVLHGIRTSDDVEIWRRIESQSPSWLPSEVYQEAIAILRAEAKAHDQH